MNKNNKLEIARNIVSRLKETEFAYLAGLYEGEGSISVNYNLKKKHLKITLEISNTDNKLIKSIKELLPFGRIALKKKQDKYLAAYAHIISSIIEICAVLERIKPYLKSAKWTRKTDYALAFLYSRILHYKEPYTMIEKSMLDEICQAKSYDGKLDFGELNGHQV